MLTSCSFSCDCGCFECVSARCAICRNFNQPSKGTELTYQRRHRTDVDHSFAFPPIPSFYSSHPFLPSILLSFLPSFLHSFLPSFLHSFLFFQHRSQSWDYVFLSLDLILILVSVFLLSSWQIIYDMFTLTPDERVPFLRGHIDLVSALPGLFETLTDL